MTNLSVCVGQDSREAGDSGTTTTHTYFPSNPACITISLRQFHTKEVGLQKVRPNACLVVYKARMKGKKRLKNDSLHRSHAFVETRTNIGATPLQGRRPPPRQPPCSLGLGAGSLHRESCLHHARRSACVQHDCGTSPPRCTLTDRSCWRCYHRGSHRTRDRLHSGCGHGRCVGSDKTCRIKGVGRREERGCWEELIDGGQVMKVGKDNNNHPNLSSRENLSTKLCNYNAGNICNDK